MNETLQVLDKLLDVSALRQRVLANNIANINTPGFKREDVTFRDAFKEAIESGSRQKIEAVQPEVEKDMTAPSRPDGNTVSMQDEMAAMTENGLLYTLATKLASAKYSRLHAVIKSR
ncbi:MAG TPA: flagellar basal body rod protein FlgB [Verrucomicrobia bacterium]|nr:MAG: flagellar basal-body rod protein FlgB [Lentisphaerae bacterium GWF2_57_35]HBA84867.1 flagellar basal body rod protein FlgB [Verrucomicrobiota bacterium]